MRGIADSLAVFSFFSKRLIAGKNSTGTLK